MQVFDRLQPAYGIAVVRVVVGVVLFMAGWSKVMGPGLTGVTAFFGSVGIPMAPVMAALVIGIELIGGLLLIVGAFSRFIGPLLIVQFLVAGLMVSLPSQQGWNAARLDFLLVAAGVLFLFAGSGCLSVDGWLKRR